jgi:hypothetical protein
MRGCNLFQIVVASVLGSYFAKLFAQRTYCTLGGLFLPHALFLNLN